MIEKAKLTWSGKVIPLEIGATPENGGTRSHVLSIGGAETLPFLHSEGSTSFPPALALEVWDVKPSEWSDVLSESFGSVLGHPVEWAQFALQRGADAICLHLTSSHPDFQDTPVAESVQLVKTFIENVSAPLILLGSGHVDKDRELLPALCEAAAGERCLVGPAVDENYRTIAAACMAFGHSLIAETPIDVNLAKQLNILCEDAGLPKERIVMHHMSSALGYGLEYTYSIMERARLACLKGDALLSQPMVSILGAEVWKTREANLPEADMPVWGALKARGMYWEAATGLAMLQAGADLLILTHPDALAIVKQARDLF
ncbi:MAG: acetyl-CoA decarbonylase/synthase complex subunit delta [Anaerolineales bacterium]